MVEYTGHDNKPVLHSMHSLLMRVCTALAVSILKHIPMLHTLAHSHVTTCEEEISTNVLILVISVILMS